MSNVRGSTALVRAANPAGLPVLALLGLVAGAVPLPYLPGVALKKIRGALVHDIASQHGLSLTDDARAAIEEASRRSKNGALLATVAFVAQRTLRRFGMLGVLPPLTAWLEVYALGLLFDRYLGRVRASSTIRIHAPEAALVRRAIDDAVSRALSPSLALNPRAPEGVAAEELRSTPTRIVDGVLLAAAAVPQHLQRRLETAFDAVIQETPLHV
jgi:hypothetical protein